MIVKKNKKTQKKQERSTIHNRYIYDSVKWRGNDGLRNVRLRISPFCIVCGKPAEMVDHIIPINMGGNPYDIENTQSMCNSCHASKSSNESRNENYRTKKSPRNI